MDNIKAFEAEIERFEKASSKVYELANKGGKKFGAAIRIRRESLNLKAYELADLVGITPVYITQIEKHGKLPSYEIMQSICNTLNDEELFKIYLKIRHPAMYKRLEDFEAARAENIDSEIEEMEKEIEEMEKGKLARKEVKGLKKQMADFGNKVGKSEVKLQESIKKLQKIKRMHSNLKDTLEQKEKIKD